MPLRVISWRTRSSALDPGRPGLGVEAEEAEGEQGEGEGGAQGPAHGAAEAEQPEEGEEQDVRGTDHFFVGFPSYWNIVAFYLFLGGLDPWINLAIVSFFIVMVFVPVKWVYPSRTARFRRVTLGASVLWGAMCITMLVQYPIVVPWLLPASLVYIAYGMAVSVVLGRSGTRRSAPSSKV